MELKASKVLSALDFLQNLAQNPLQSVSSKNRTILDEIRNSYLPKNTKHTHTHTHNSKKRKHPPSKSIGPNPKRQKTHKQKNPKQENNSNEDSSTDSEIEISTDSSTDHNHHHNGAQLISHHASNHNITGDSPSHFTYFTPSHGTFIPNHNALSPLYSRGEPRHNDLDNYLHSIGKIFYHPMEAMEDNHTNLENYNDNIFRYSSINLILSPLRKRSPFDEWNPREIALFESGICSKGKQFYEISKIIKSKNTKQCVEFYYFWKQSAHYMVWKALGKNVEKKLSKAQKKLHEKIGWKFAQFHRRNLVVDNGGDDGGDEKEIIDLPSLTSIHNGGDGGDDVVQGNNGGGVGQIIGYYPQYYTQGNGGNLNGGYVSVGGVNGGYPSWYVGGGNVYGVSEYEHVQGVNEEVNVGVNGENGDFIDLTETASSNGTKSKSASPQEVKEVKEVKECDGDIDIDDL